MLLKYSKLEMKPLALNLKLHLKIHLKSENIFKVLNTVLFQGTPCLKQARNLKVNQLQLDSNPEPLSS